MRTSQQIKSFVSEDISAIINMANHKCKSDMKVVSIKLSLPDYVIDDSDEDVVVTASAKISSSKGEFKFEWDYLIDDDSIYIEDEDKQLALDLARKYGELRPIKSAHYSNMSTITAAGSDDSYDLDDKQFEDASIADSIDDLSDQVDDLQDSVDDVNEDEPAIETDNNISNHYIAECDNCHGIFISAVIESDQQIKSISGVCPLCQKQSDQLLKWVIKDVIDNDR